MPSLVFTVLVFLAIGSFFLFIHLVMGKVIRPAKPESEKLTIYECGEPTVGSAWIQFDLRYYVVALLFVVFDVEVAFFFPWAVVYGNVNALRDPTLTDTQRAAITSNLVPTSGAAENPKLLLPAVNGTANSPQVISSDAAQSWAWIALGDIMVFFAVLMVGFAYLWRRGDIDWVRSIRAEEPRRSVREDLPVLPETGVLVGAGK